MTLTLELTDTSGKIYSLTECITFVFTKEAYTPYTLFEGLFHSELDDTNNIKSVRFRIDEKMVHYGIVDSIGIERAGNKGAIRVKSKSFTSLFCQNQPLPGLRTSSNLQSLVSEFAISHVSCEGTQTLNYIYIREGSTTWDAIANFNFRLNGGYPYIEGANKVRVTERTPISRTITKENAVKHGIYYDYTKIVSHLHMKDAEETYESFNKSSVFAIERELIRHKQIPLDMQYLSDPDSGLLFKLNYSQRGCRCIYVEYNGYMEEDLYDTLSFDTITEGKIKKIQISGENGNVKTLLGVYEDAF